MPSPWPGVDGLLVAFVPLVEVFVFDVGAEAVGVVAVTGVAGVHTSHANVLCSSHDPPSLLVSVESGHAVKFAKKQTFGMENTVSSNAENPTFSTKSLVGQPPSRKAACHGPRSWGSRHPQRTARTSVNPTKSADRRTATLMTHRPRSLSLRAVWQHPGGSSPCGRRDRLCLAGAWLAPFQ